MPEIVASTIDGTPLQEDGRQERHPHDDPALKHDSGKTKMENGRDGDDNPCHGEHHGEGIAAYHPATVLSDVAMTDAIERDSGSDHPSEGLRGRGGDERKGINPVRGHSSCK